MLIEKLKYKLDNQNYSIELEPWMKFGIFIGNYIKMTDMATKIYISVPSNLLFSYFVVIGAIDYDFENTSQEELKKQYLGLQKGHRVLYLSGDKWKICSILKVGESPYKPDLKAVVLLDNLKTTVYVPEHQWFTHIRLLNDEIIEVKNAKVVQNIKRLSEHSTLKNFYSTEKLSLAESLNMPHTYICANKKEWLEYLLNLKLDFKNNEINLRHFIFDGTESPFKNIEFISQNIDYTLPKDSTVIFIGSGKTLLRMEQFDQYRCIYIIDKHDSTEKLDDLKYKIEQRLLTQGCEIINNDFIETLVGRNIQLPKGVELLAWKQES